MTTIHCIRCQRRVKPQHRNQPHRADTMRGRQLCSNCYQTAWKTGALTDYERHTRSRDEVLDDYQRWRAFNYDPLESQGENWRACAEWLGMTYAAFERAMLRARRDGDPRAATTRTVWPSRGAA